MTERDQARAAQTKVGRGDWIPRPTKAEVLADVPGARNVKPELLPEGVAKILGSALVLYHHLVTALAAVHEPMEQSLSRPRNTAGLVAVVLGVVIAQQLLNPLVCIPRDIGRIPVANNDPPLVGWP